MEPIIPNQLTKFESPIYDNFRDILFTNDESIYPNLICWAQCIVVDGIIYTHVQWKRTTLPMRIFVAYQKLCKIVLFIIII